MSDNGYSSELRSAERRLENKDEPAIITAFALVSIARSLELIAFAIGNHDNCEGMAGSLSGIMNAAQQIAWPSS
jgi:hypothetical protein